MSDSAAIYRPGPGPDRVISTFVAGHGAHIEFHGLYDDTPKLTIIAWCAECRYQLTVREFDVSGGVIPDGVEGFAEGQADAMVQHWKEIHE